MQAVNRRKKESAKRCKRIFCIARDWCGAFAFFVIKQQGGMLSKTRCVYCELCFSLSVPLANLPPQNTAT